MRKVIMYVRMMICRVRNRKVRKEWIAEIEQLIALADAE